MIMIACVVILWVFYIEATLYTQEADKFHWTVGAIHLVTTVLTFAAVLYPFDNPRMAAALLLMPLVWISALAIGTWMVIYDGPVYVSMYRVETPSTRDWILAIVCTVYVVANLAVLVSAIL